jgi:hypothetical protein
VQLNVNRGAADELLSLAYTAQQQQNKNTDLIMKQGEQIDRIGQTVDNIQNKLDRGDHLLRGVESYRYFAYGFGGKNKKKRAEVRWTFVVGFVISLNFSLLFSFLCRSVLFLSAVGFGEEGCRASERHCAANGD